VLPRPYDDDSPRINAEVWDWLEVNGVSEKVVVSRDKLDDMDAGNLFPFKHCDGHFFVPILNANGDLCVCMYQTDKPEFVFGNIYEQSYKAIWMSDRRRKVIEHVRSYDYSTDCQPCCKLTEINKLLHMLQHQERPGDINFL